MAFNLEKIERQNKPKAQLDFSKLLQKEISFSAKGFNGQKKEKFYTELGVLLNAGINLKDALILIKDELKKPKEQELIGTIVELVIKGSQFSEGIKSIGGFTEYEYYSIKIGEETGTLSKVSQELGLFFKRKNEQRKNLMNAISYPLVVLATAVLSVFFMLRFVVPMFADIFKQNGVELPLLTKIIISASRFLEAYYWVLFLGIACLLVTIKMLKNKILYKRIMAKVLLRIPFVGELLRKTYLAQFTQAVALLTSANVPLLNSLKLTEKMIDFYPLKTALTGVQKSVLGGSILSDSLRPYKIFDTKMISLIKVAEETNQNNYIFERLTTQYSEEVQYKSKMLSTILEPVIILILGSFVALILIAMYLPMFKLSTVLG